MTDDGRSAGSRKRPARFVASGKGTNPAQAMQRPGASSLGSLDADVRRHPDATMAQRLAERQADAPLPGGLVHVSDELLPGITRRRRAQGFVYFLPDGSRLRDEAELARIRKLAIPPAYRQVWICPLANGHLQATGRDARGRKQYRYHPEWKAHRDADKFARLIAFARALPAIRRRVARDLASDDGHTASLALVLATLVRLLDRTFVRVGNEAYARQNGSYGLTTLRNRHAGVRGTELRLSFRGKSGVRHDVRIDDRRVARVVRRCQQLPGQELFQYEADGQVRAIGSAEVNDYLAEAAGERFTAKDFRTWHGSVLALELTRLACSPASTGAARASASQILAQVAKALGNTVAVCRKAYVHPAVLALGERLGDDEAVLELAQQLDETVSTLSAQAEDPALGAATLERELRSRERRLLGFLVRAEQLAQAATTATADKTAGETPAHPARAAPSARLRRRS